MDGGIDRDGAFLHAAEARASEFIPQMLLFGLHEKDFLLEDLATCN